MQSILSYPSNSNCAQATWSKTESLVIVGQTLYPDIFNFVVLKGGLKPTFTALVCERIRKGCGSLFTVCRLMLFVKSVYCVSPNQLDCVIPRLLAFHGSLPFYDLVSRQSRCGVALQPCLL